MSQHGTFTINIGQTPSAATAGTPSTNYFGMTIGAIPQPDGTSMGQAITGDGSYPIPVLTANQGGSFANITSGTVTLSGNMTKGQITGTGTVVQGSNMQQGQPMSGSFTC